ncbi:MAG: EF-hand domain-containing protein [Fuerstiella sp.]
MKKLTMWLLTLAVAGIAADAVVAQREDEGDKPREEERDRDRDEDRGEDRDAERDEDRERDGDRERRRERDRERERGRERDGDRPRGPRDGDSPREGGPREGGPRDGEGRRPPFPGGPILAALDTNRNGVLESEEIDQAIIVLRRLDRDQDGRLTPDELRGRGPRDGDRPPGFAGPPPGRGEGRRGDGRPGEGRRGEGRPSPEQMMARFREADANKDGKLSKEEAPDRMKEGFGRLDTNDDGFVDEEEFEAMIRRMRDGGPGRPERDGEGRGRGERGDGRGERDLDRPRERDGDRPRPDVE